MIVIAALLLQSPGPVFMQETASGGEIELHGSLTGDFSRRASNERPAGEEGRDFLLAEERLRLDIFGWMESIEASARVKGDLLLDNVIDKWDVDLREAYLDYVTKSFDFRLGRQIITWGVGDLLFINDAFPKDYVSFFSGRPLEYLKRGVDGLRVRYSSAPVNAELIAIPFFEPNSMPGPDRFLLYSPLPAIAPLEEQEPDTTLDNTQLALRLYRRIRGFDVSAYAYRGFWLTPNIRLDDPTAPEKVIMFHPSLSIYGMSAQGGALGGVLGCETGYYLSRDDEKGTDPFSMNSQIRFLIGYQRQLWEDFTLGVQYYGEYMTQHDEYVEYLPGGSPKLDEYRDIITLRLTQLSLHQTLKLSLFAFYSPSDEDYMVIPEAKYGFTDEFSAALGINVFGGPKDAPNFGQFGSNDNIYAVAKYEF